MNFKLNGENFLGFEKLKIFSLPFLFLLSDFVYQEVLHKMFTHSHCVLLYIFFINLWGNVSRYTHSCCCLCLTCTFHKSKNHILCQNFAYEASWNISISHFNVKSAVLLSPFMNFWWIFFSWGLHPWVKCIVLRRKFKVESLCLQECRRRFTVGISI